MSTGQPRRAYRHAKRAAELWGKTTRPSYAAIAIRMVAVAATAMGEPEEAERHLNDLQERWPELWEMFPDYWITHGEVARQRGDLVTAEASYNSARRVFSHCGAHPDLGMVISLNLALIQLKRGEWSRVRAGLTDLRTTRHDQWTGCAEILSATAYAGESRWRESMVHLERGIPMIGALVDRDLVMATQLTAALAAAAGEGKLAELASGFARQQWHALGGSGPPPSLSD